MTVHGVRLAVLAVIGIVLALVAARSPVAAAGGTLRVEPATQSVAGSAEFTVNIIQNADVATAGAQASLRFDPAILEVVDVQPGAPYAAGQLLLPGTPEQAIGEANGTGLLRCVATFFVPGAGSVPAGDAEFLVVKMRAKAGGTSALELVGEGCQTAEAKLEMIDAEGVSIPVTGANGSVTVEGAAAPQPGVTSAPTQTPAGTPTTAIGTLVPVSTPQADGTQAPEGTVGLGSENTISFDPITYEAEKGESFQVNVVTNSTGPIAIVSAQLAFDSAVVRVASIEPGSAWEGASGAAPSNIETAVSQANETGSIELGFSATEPIAAGKQVLFTLNLVAADRDAKTLFRFVSSEMVGGDGVSLTYVTEAGQIIVGSGGGGGIDTSTLILGSLLTLSVGATGGGTYFMVRRRRRQWAV